MLCLYDFWLALGLGEGSCLLLGFRIYSTSYGRFFMSTLLGIRMFTVSQLELPLHSIFECSV